MIEVLQDRTWLPLCLMLSLAVIVSGCDEGSMPTGVDGEEAPAPVFSKGGSAVQGQYIVVLKDDFAPGGHARNRAAAAEVARGLGLSPVHTYGSALYGFSAAVPEGRLQGLERDPRVAYVNVDAPVQLPAPIRAQAPRWCADNPDHPACADDGGGGGQTLPWGVDRVDADLNSNEGTGIHVYVIDSGIDADHPDLQANLGNGYAVESCRGGSCTAAWDDDNDHGTHVAGTIGALNNDIDVVGVASEVTLHAVKVLAKNGSGSWSGVVAGIDWVTSETQRLGVATVANMSLGGSGSKTGTCTSDRFTGTDSMHEALCNAARAGVVVVVAAGNEGADAANYVPAAFDDAVITVSATNSNDQFESWSNWGDDGASWTPNVSAPVAVAAPGGSIISTKRGGGTTTMSGTSMASPHVAGGAALYLKSSTQSTGYSAFSNTRTSLLSGAEDATGFGNEDASNPHDEDFLDAESL